METHHRSHITHHQLERVAGIEPASLAWKASALPLSYTRPEELVGEAGFEPATSASRTLRANQAALLSDRLPNYTRSLPDQGSTR